MASTPMKRDKRFLLTVGVISAVLGLVSCDKHLNEQELTWLGLTLTAFITQSQIGQRYGEKTATKAVANGAPPPGEPAA